MVTICLLYIVQLPRLSPPVPSLTPPKLLPSPPPKPAPVPSPPPRPMPNKIVMSVHV